MPTVLAEHARPADKDAYPDWTTYVQTFVSQGQRNHSALLLLLNYLYLSRLMEQSSCEHPINEID